jgi:hypothetical protein
MASNEAAVEAAASGEPESPGMLVKLNPSSTEDKGTDGWHCDSENLKTRYTGTKFLNWEEDTIIREKVYEANDYIFFLLNARRNTDITPTKLEELAKKLPFTGDMLGVFLDAVRDQENSYWIVWKAHQILEFRNKSQNLRALSDDEKIKLLEEKMGSLRKELWSFKQPGRARIDNYNPAASLNLPDPGQRIGCNDEFRDSSWCFYEKDGQPPWCQTIVRPVIWGTDQKQEDKIRELRDWLRNQFGDVVTIEQAKAIGQHLNIPYQLLLLFLDAVECKEDGRFTPYFARFLEGEREFRNNETIPNTFAENKRLKADNKQLEQHVSLLKDDLEKLQTEMYELTLQGAKCVDKYMVFNRCCANCGMVPESGNAAGSGNDEPKLLKCEQCSIAQYCGKECQKQHWNRGHDTACALLKKNDEDSRKILSLASSCNSIKRELKQIRQTTVSKTELKAIQDENKLLLTSKKKFEGRAQYWYDVAVELEITNAKQEDVIKEKDEMIEKMRKRIIELEAIDFELLRECPICMERDLSHVLSPCGHETCDFCAFGIINARNPTCPTCNAPVQRYTQLFRTKHEHRIDEKPAAHKKKGKKGRNKQGRASDT